MTDIKKNSLILYNKYSREDFVKLLNWDKMNLEQSMVIV